MRSSVKTLHFPSAGLDRSQSYRIATEPSEGRVYATPFAVNVRGIDVFGGRYRGGSRPGLKSIESFSSAGMFEKPTTFYRGRKIYAEGSLWYASRTGDITDFEVSGDGDDPTRPMMGKVGFASVNDADNITAIFCVSNDALFMATAKSLWAIDGDVGSGNMRRISAYAGAVSKDAWAFDGSVYYFVSSNGLYAYVPGQGVVKVSANVPEEMNAISTVLCAYDPEHNALHIFTDKGDWFFDIGAKAWWPQRFPSAYRPIDRGIVLADGVHKVALLGEDGIWRVFDDKTATDEGDTIVSSVAIGPIRTGSSEIGDGILDMVSASLSSLSAEVRCDFYVGKTAEDSVVSSMNDAKPVYSLSLKGGFNGNLRVRVRGAWATIVLSSTKPWAFESMSALTKALGGLR